jgi:hypothetical protein
MITLDLRSIVLTQWRCLLTLPENRAEILQGILWKFPDTQLCLIFDTAKNTHRLAHEGPMAFVWTDRFGDY